MKSILITTTLATAVVVLSEPLRAAPAQSSFDTCVKAFVLTLPEKVGAAPRLRDARLVGRVNRDEAPVELEMIATNPKNNKVVWKATCVVNERGELVAMRDRR